MRLSEDDLLEVCSFAVKKAVERGADEAEAYGISSVETEASLERNDVTLGKFHQASGIGIRILKNTALGFSSINTLSREEVAASVEAAIKIASKGSPDKYNTLPKPSSIQKVSGILDPEAENFRPEDALRNAVNMLQTARGYDERVTVDSGVFNTSLTSHTVVNSNGVECGESTSNFTWFIMGMAVDGGEVSSFDFQFDGTHHVKKIDVVETARSFAENVVGSLGSKRCDAFKGTLILSPQAAVELIVPTLVSSVNSNNVQKGRSRFIGRLGEEVASRDLTVVDDASWSEGLAASSFDREGVPHSPLPIIENGVLRSFLYNTYTAGRDGVDSTGHAAGDEESSPRVGVTNIILRQGSSTFEDMLGEVERGILATRFSGNVNPISGDFSGVVKGGHLIVGGEKVHPLKETLIAGNIFELLKNISGLSRERQKIFHYLLPYIRAEDISVTSG
ncbi:MAG: TldD/PmbA family protein [Nitrososphaerales archaeon]